VGSPASSQATLSVSSLPPAPAPGAAAAAASKVVPEPCVLLASRALQAVADMLLQLEYTAGEQAALCTAHVTVPSEGQFSWPSLHEHSSDAG
jgi:hypothetical protein